MDSSLTLTDSDYSDSSLEESDESSIDVSNREIKHALSAGGLDLHLETVMNKDDLAFVPQNATLIMRVALFLTWTYRSVSHSILSPESTISWFAEIVAGQPLQLQMFCKHLSTKLHFAPGTIMNYCDDLRVAFNWLTLFSSEAVYFRSRQSEMSAFLLVVVNMHSSQARN